MVTLPPVDPTERLSADDMATRREAEFLAAALQQAVLPGHPVARGWCSNCGERCHPRTVYCDADCRMDHEAQLRARQRAGR